MTVHLLAGSGSGNNLYDWGRAGVLRKVVNPLATVEPTACGMRRPTADLTTDEKAVTCGSCKRADEYGDNRKRRLERERARRRRDAQRLAARNRALRLLTDHHADEYASLFDDELTIIVLGRDIPAPGDIPWPAKRPRPPIP